jgi:putative ABC transport system ATP-binding protein
MTAPVIRCEGLVKIYKTAEIEVVALQGLDLEVEQGDMVAVVGASGSGKSTLLNILAGLDVPSAGKTMVAGHDLLGMGTRERTRYRRSAVGFVWQQTARNLLPYLTAARNIELPLALAGVRRQERRRRVAELLDMMSLADRAHHLPRQLSGGQQQRVAIAVALANRPRVILADEPTGELDSATSAEVLAALRTANEETGVTGFIVTHDPLVSESVGRTVRIRDGRISTETLRRAAYTHLEGHHVVAEEFAVLDRAGRLQLPADYVEALRLAKRVRLLLEDDHIEIWPGSD